MVTTVHQWVGQEGLRGGVAEPPPARTYPATRPKLRVSGHCNTPRLTKTMLLDWGAESGKHNLG